jgi:RNA polymerase sigma-70 factor, ECF subfamily
MEPDSIAEPWNGLAELRPAVRDFLFRHCRDESEAEDIAQDTLLRASRYRGSLAEARRLRPWLLRIALNVLRDHVRRERRLPRIEADQDLFDRLEGREDVPGDVREDVQVELDGALVEKPRVLVQLCDAKSRLRVRDRLVLDSHYEAGRSCGETALVCEIPRDLVKVRLFRARRRLQRALRTRLRSESETLRSESETTYDRAATCGAAHMVTEDGVER